MAAAHVATLAQLPSEIVTATQLFADGELVPAEAHRPGVSARARQSRRRHAPAREDRPRTRRARRRRNAARGRARRWRRTTARPATTMRIALLRRHKHVQAIAELEKLLQLDPGNRAYRTTYATANVGLGDHEQALGLYRELLVDAPRAADLHLSVAHSLKTLGRQQEAIDAYRAAAAVRPNYGDAYWSLANLKTYRFTDEEIARMRAEEAARDHRSGRSLPPVLRARQGARGPRRISPSRIGTMSAAMRSRNRRAATVRNPSSATRACRGRSARANSSPRAGASAAAAPTRSSSSACRAPGRRCSSRSSPRTRRSRARWSWRISRAWCWNCRAASRTASNPRYPRVLAELKPEDFLRLGEKYLGDTRVYRTRQAVLHRQDAEQLPPHRPDPPDPAECQDHRRAARTRWPAASAISSSCSRRARNSPTASRTSPAITAPTSS